MGMTLFESSGTFSPSDYGLSVGDVIHIIAVGGGGGGAGCVTLKALTAGSNGSASSFGNVLTAPGGSGGSTTPGSSGSPGCWGTPAAASNSQIQAYLTVPIGTSSVPVYYTIGGCGANGWLPDGRYIQQASSQDLLATLLVPYQSYSMQSASAITSTAGLIFPYSLHTGNYSINVVGQSSAQTAQRGGYGGIRQEGSQNSYNCIQAGGPGGIGYGAGGGGACTSQYGYLYQCGAPGGNAGVISSIDHILSSSDPVSFAVTVGEGGAGAVTSNGYCNGGGGARGCVAIWW